MQTSTPEQKKRLLKAKIAVALQDELGRVPKEAEINQVFLLTRVMYKAGPRITFQTKGTEAKGAARNLLTDTPMLIGYARISTTDQTLALQQDALKKAGCEKTFTDTASGSIADRHGLEEAISQLRPGDALVVWRLDRLGRSLRHLIETITALHTQGIGFKSLTEQIDTTTSGGKLIFHIFGALAEFERDIIRERTQAGLAAARARGRQGGRPKLSGTARKVALARKLYEDRQTPVQDICRDLHISRATLYRYLRRK